MVKQTFIFRCVMVSNSCRGVKVSWCRGVSHTPNVAAMTCEACEAETQTRLIARGKRSATPGIRHPTILRPQRQAIDESLTKSIVTQQKG